MAPEGLAGLSSRVVELACLANDDGAGADDCERGGGNDRRNDRQNNVTCHGTDAHS